MSKAEDKYTVKISDIENSETKEIKRYFQDFIEGIDSKNPLSAELTLIDLGEFIKVTGHVNGIATLICDLCLEPFEYIIDIDIEELFSKQEYITEAKQEIEIKENGFITDLNGASEIDIKDLLYQTVILDFPNKKVCDINCNGGDIFIREEDSQEEIDPRMSIFKNIKINKQKEGKNGST